MSTTRRTAGVFSRERPLGPNGERLCYNCGGLLPKGKRFNCSAACSEEWRIRTSPSHMRYLVSKRDKGVCARCGSDTEALKAIYEGIRREKPDPNKPFDLTVGIREQFLQAYGIPPSRSWGDWWDADHIVPVIEGGGECGLSNYRTLCIPCHKRATAELRSRLAKSGRATRAALKDESRPLFQDLL